MSHQVRAMTIRYIVDLVAPKLRIPTGATALQLRQK